MTEQIFIFMCLGASIASVVDIFTHSPRYLRLFSVIFGCILAASTNSTLIFSVSLAIALLQGFMYTYCGPKGEYKGVWHYYKTRTWY